MKETEDTELFIPLLSPLLLMFAIFIIDLQLPLGVAGGVPYIAVVVLSLWHRNYKYVIGLATLCSMLTLLGFYFSQPGGELWIVITNRVLALFAIWVTAILAIKWKNSVKASCQLKLEALKKREKEKRVSSTMKSSEQRQESAELV